MAKAGSKTGSSLPDILSGTSAALAALEKRVAAVSMVVIVLAIGVTILARLLNLPVPGLGEIAIVAMSPLAFIGGAFCSHMHHHITIDVVGLMREGPAKTLLRMAATLAMAAFAGTFAWLAWDLFSYALESGERLIDLGTPVWIPTGCIFLGAALMCVHAVLEAVRLAIAGTGDPTG